jgi:ABC-type polysaccharide/polyol phosphate transport system ATPase subunit
MSNHERIPVISVRNVRKDFKFWNERPNSMKTLLVDVLRGRFQFGSFKKFNALDDISLDVYPGEFVGLMGRNGAGKSTLFKLISGIYTPTSGSIKVGATVAPLIELGAGFHDELSGYENIFLNAAILGFGQKVTQEALPKILEFADLGEHINMPVRKYSSGMLIRLAFSIATHLTAPILLIDEVLAVGDYSFQKKCLAKIHELHAKGTTILLVTHSPDSVRAHCSRCIVIDQHKKIYDGPAAAGVSIYEKL